MADVEPVLSLYSADMAPDASEMYGGDDGYGGDAASGASYGGAYGGTRHPATLGGDPGRGCCEGWVIGLALGALILVALLVIRACCGCQRRHKRRSPPRALMPPMITGGAPRPSYVVPGPLGYGGTGGAVVIR